MKDLNNYMMIFRFEPSDEYQPTPQEEQAMHQSWGAFIGNLAIKERLVGTHQLGFTGKQISADLSVSEGINVSDGKTLGGNMVVKANTIDEAVEMAKNCPILTMGGTVEVRDIMPMS